MSFFLAYIYRFEFQAGNFINPADCQAPGRLGSIVGPGPQPKNSKNSIRKNGTQKVPNCDQTQQLTNHTLEVFPFQGCIAKCLCPAFVTKTRCFGIFFSTSSNRCSKAGPPKPSLWATGSEPTGRCPTGCDRPPFCRDSSGSHSQQGWPGAT